MAFKIWEPNKAYDILRYYVDFTTRSLFSSVKINGRENLPEDGMVMYAPNHCAALIDPLMILLIRKKPVAFGARYDIFQKGKTISDILHFLRILPIARERDGLNAVATNLDTYDQIIECLYKGVPFTLYAEGAHRAERGMMPVKKGIFRIAKMAAERTGKKMWIVPIGVDYEYFFRQTGRATISIGKPLELNEYLEQHSDRTEFINYRELCTWLRETDMSMIGKIPERSHKYLIPRMLLAILSLPVFLPFAILAAPIWLTAELILRNFKDKAWTHTVYFAVRLLLPVFVPFQFVYSYLMKLYVNILEDLRK